MFVSQVQGIFSVGLLPFPTPNYRNIMPVSDWLKSWLAEQPPQKNEAIMVAESLLMELDFQMREVENIQREEEQTLKRKKSGVDYNWLLADSPKPYEMPQLERLELEEMCLKVSSKYMYNIISIISYQCLSAC